MRRPVRVAVAGLGWAGRELWLPRLLEHSAYQLTALVDPDPRGQQAVAAVAVHAGVPILADTAELSPETVDLVVVAVPNHLHTETAAALLRRGISVFLEKPVCLSSAEVAVLASAEQQGGAVLLAGSAARHRADVRELALLATDLGRLRHVDLAWVRARGIPRAGGWFTQRDKAGGGALVDLGWHLLDTLGVLLGPSRIDRVLGATSADFVNDSQWRAAWRTGDPPPSGGSDVEDTARGFMIREDGVSVALRASWASHEATDTTRLSIEGSTGTATLTCTFGFSPNRPPEPVLTVTRRGGITRLSVPSEPIGAEYGRQLDELATNGWEPGKAVEEARAAVHTIESFYRSAAGPAGPPLAPDLTARQPAQ